ncbi:uncharacterized protein (TIGR02217 family) [Novosphingobium sp. 1748]|uniref:DUF2460 domain-containing protein n=1 Tax=Novosphingobium sp. 1748 TaxID=2817760 RepID=UPI00285F53EA|nr:DUF2460 domain-containing protein [Novosphingobium sp. 1748]MDR6710005.1 uncharacterized protein (TIGR02217 family) [Novosphingobium sp. 1748]
MAFWLASTREGQETDWIQRFDPRFWTVNFPRPMMAAITTPAPDTLRLDACFLTQGDLAGLIWESEDTLDHPLLSYATGRDYTGTTLSFHWRSNGLVALDQANGPTLTIEGRDAAGAAHTWFVRLWNFASGSGEDAQVTLNFSEVFGGWSRDSGIDPLYPADIDRMFISLVPSGYVAGSATPLSASADAWAEMTNIRCTGRKAMLRIGNVFVPPHGLAMATAYDDSFNQTPARLLRSVRQLGYRGSILHYVGMSHFFQLTASGGSYLVGLSGDPLCLPARAWHSEFFAACQAWGYSPIVSLSYEVLAAHCPSAWQQRAANGDPALTGWSPPSALMSPANTAAMTWQKSVAAAFAQLLVDAGCAVRFQVGEPWWWVMGDGRICIYDDAAKAAFGGSPVAIPDLRASLTSAQTALLDQAGAMLAASTIALAGAARAVAQTAGVASETLLLTFVPTVLDPATPEARRVNMPVGWASPAFDRLQVEDYDWLTAGADARRYAAYQFVNDRLGYPPEQQDYLAGFVLLPSQSAQWRMIYQGIGEARDRAAHEIFVWALPQVCRDGFVALPVSEDSNDMNAFDDVAYPLPLGLDTKISPAFSTSVTTTASGFERRNSLWNDARLSFDVGPGIRSEQDLGCLLGFFRARRGPARGFRLSDPSDFSSNGMTGTPSAGDQVLGIGDGLLASFPLVKRYGAGALGDDEAQLRRITRPRSGSVLVSVNGMAQASGWVLGAGGIVQFTTPPAAGAIVRAGFMFDVPVRFEQDRLDISGLTFLAGEAPSVPLIEVREAV